MKKLISILLVAMLIISMIPATVSAADTEIEFALGANGATSHKDGSSDLAAYTETVGDYTLNLTGGTKMYPSSYDAKGNSCIKLGTSSKVGGFSFEVPSDVTNVIICIGKYKTNTTKITVNGTAYTLTKNSNDGAYDEITVDTSSTKTVTLTTVSGGVRAMVNTIKYIIPAAEGDCQHENTTTTTVEATCIEAGSTTVTCDDCGDVVDTEVIPATNHVNQTLQTEAVAGNCQTEGTAAVYTCDDCGATLGGESTGLGDHSYANGTCTVCGESEPAARFEFGENGAAGHKDGTAASEYTESVGDYTLTLTDCVKVYSGAYDAMGNSCIKLGTGSAIGGFSFTVPAEVSSVIIYVAAYKANDATITVNGASYTLTSKSNDGEYDAIEVDTSATKTVTLSTTTSSDERAMVNAIEFYTVDLFEDANGNGYPTVKEALRNQVTVLKAIDESTEMPFDVTADGTRYIGLEGENGFYNYYTLDLKLTGLNLRAGEAGIYYRAKVTCDDTLAAAVDSYGIVLSTNDMPGTDIAASDNAYTTVTGPVPVNTEILSGSVFNIFKDGAEAEDNRTRGTTGIFATVYLNIDGNIVVATQEVQWSLQKVLQTVNAQLETLAPEAAQKEALCDFYKKWAVDTQVIDANVEGWNLANIAALYTG